MNMKFTFSTYVAPAAYGHPERTCRTLSAADGVHRRYSACFYALLTEVFEDSVDQALDMVEQIEERKLPSTFIGGNVWEIEIRHENVEFISDVEPGIVDGVQNVFSFNEFKWVLLAWREFLKMKNFNPASYEFIVPNTLPPKAHGVHGSLLMRV